MALKLILYAMILIIFSGIPGLFSKATSQWGQRVATTFMLLGAIIGLIGSGVGIFSNPTPLFIFPWSTVGNATIGLDALSSFFLMPVFLIGGLGSLYGLGYWEQSLHPSNARTLQFFWGLLVGGMILLLIGKDALSFILGWEFMALSAFFLVGAEHEDAECRKSSLLYLISTHISTLTLFCFFALWRYVTGSFQLLPIAFGTVDPRILNLLFLLAFLGFGLKAGMVPLHFWLPSAHANAPSHVSAILSGVMLKMGIYGIMRVAFLLPVLPSFFGGLILAFGAISGLLGVVFALAQKDIKRLLAYSSVENIGIILMGFGLAMIGRSYDKPLWVAWGMSSSLLHIWNHSLFKPLLFFGAGSVLHATGKRRLDILGGLSKKMPLTALFFLTGAVAISGMPPLNGFISELFLYVGLIYPIAEADSHAFGITLFAPVLALIGALVAASFVKVYTTVFLGSARTEPLHNEHEASLTMLIPMGVLALISISIGLLPQYYYPFIEAVSGQKNLAQEIPLNTLSAINIGLVISLGIFSGWIFILTKSHKKVVTWDCGYATPTSRMQYNGSSFGHSITSMFEWVLRSQEHKSMIKTIHPTNATLESHINEFILDRFIIPIFSKMKSIFSWFYRFQQGQSQKYILYILITVILLLSLLIPYYI